MAGADVHQLLADLLEPWRRVIGADFQGYKNHCHRMVTFCLLLRPATPEEEQKIAVAACFHDIGLWTAGTLDYLPPSAILAADCLRAQGRADWVQEVGLMISEHHKLTAFADPHHPLVEAFRRADFVDFSLGALRFGLPRSAVRQVKAQYPNAGFHRALVRMASRWIIRHPFRPVPMMKW